MAFFVWKKNPELPQGRTPESFADAKIILFGFFEYLYDFVLPLFDGSYYGSTIPDIIAKHKEQEAE